MTQLALEKTAVQCGNFREKNVILGFLFLRNKNPYISCPPSVKGHSFRTLIAYRKKLEIAIRNTQVPRMQDPISTISAVVMVCVVKPVRHRGVYDLLNRQISNSCFSFQGFFSQKKTLFKRLSPPLLVCYKTQKSQLSNN